MDVSYIFISLEIISAMSPWLSPLQIAILPLIVLFQMKLLSTNMKFPSRKGYQRFFMPGKFFVQIKVSKLLLNHWWKIRKSCYDIIFIICNLSSSQLPERLYRNWMASFRCIYPFYMSDCTCLQDTHYAACYSTTDLRLQEARKKLQLRTICKNSILP